jgi:hypothetical protein
VAHLWQGQDRGVADSERQQERVGWIHCIMPPHAAGAAAGRATAAALAAGQCPLSSPACSQQACTA